jgi:hypothetical protein
MNQVPTVNVLALLQEKNSLLDSFLTLTVEELAKVKKKKYDTLERFYQHRDKILNLIKVISEHCDRQLNETPLNSEEQRLAKQLVAQNDDVINRILDLDLEMIAIVDHEKNLVIRELQSVSANKKILKAYRSGL